MLPRGSAGSFRAKKRVNPNISQIFCYDIGSHRMPKPSLARRPQRVSTHCRPPYFGKALACSDLRRLATKCVRCPCKQLNVEVGLGK